MGRVRLVADLTPRERRRQQKYWRNAQAASRARREQCRDLTTSENSDQSQSSQGPHQKNKWRLVVDVQ